MGIAKTGTEVFLSKLSDGELFFDTKEAVRNEREATSTVVKYLREVNARELYLKYACKSLHQFATEKLGYCGSSAQARINAMELVIALPEIEEKIETGELFLTSAAKLHTFFRLEKKAKKTYGREEKLQVVEDCLSKSTRDVDRELAKRNPDVAKFEIVKPVGVDRFELKFSVSEELEANIRKLKGLLAHSHPNITTEELLGKLVELGLQKFDPVRKAERLSKRRELVSKTSAEIADIEVEAIKRDYQLRAHETPDEKSRYITAAVKSQVWRRNDGQGCEFQSTNGDRCGSQHALQLDHIQGFAVGGGNYVENLRVLCGKHNRFVWKQQRGTRASFVRESFVQYGAA